MTPPKKITPKLHQKDGKIIADSRDIAKHFGKRHDNVLQAIQKLGCSQEFRLLNFKDTFQTVKMPKC